MTLQTTHFSPANSAGFVLAGRFLQHRRNFALRLGPGTDGASEHEQDPLELPVNPDQGADLVPKDDQPPSAPA